MRTTLAATLSVSLALLSCGPPRARWQPRLDPEGPAAYGVVWLGSPLRTRPDVRAPIVDLAAGVVREPWARGALASFRVRRSRAGWVELETIGPSAGSHCADALPGLAPFRVLVYAHEGALTPVTTREVAQRFEDGTAIELARGVPLEALPQRGLRRARFGPAGAVVALPAQDVGTRYLPSARAVPRAVGAIAPDAVAAAVPILGTTGRVDAERAVALPVQGIERQGAELLVESRSACGLLRVRVPESALGPEPVDESPPSPTGPPFVRAGAAIHWPDGRTAGVVAEATGLGAEVQGTAAHRCFSIAVGGAPAPAPVATDVPAPPTYTSPATLTLCFARADLAERAFGSAGRLADPR